MTANAASFSRTPSISLACVEIKQFRRLSNARLDLDQSTTILVGANNSGKTSIMTAVKKFLSEAPAFKAFDISLSQWQKLRELGLAWEALAEDPATDFAELEKWNTQLQLLLNCMPSLDLWFNASEGAYNYVAPFLTSLKWNGGAVGVRVRLEPVSSVADLQSLAWQYREARRPVRGLEKAAHAWPVDLLDYWLRHPRDLRAVVAYKLDPKKGPLVGGKKHERQNLPADAVPIDLVNLSRLIRVDFVPAQRGLGAEGEDARSDSDTHRIGLFSNQLIRFARQHLNVETTGHGHRADLVQAVANAQAELDKTIREALDPSVEEVKILGYPGLYDPQEFNFRTRIQTADLLDHSTAVQYRVDSDSVDEFLPEYSIGLGYQNLQSLSYQLVSFKASRLKPPKGAPAAVHLVMVEEPEAHLHVQVQRIFPGKAHKLICSTEAEHSKLSSQLLISTHSSHLAHAESLARLRYVRRLSRKCPGDMPSTEVVNLGDAFGDDIETRTFAERYFRVQHTDLLFADAAIFVEGTAERMLVPLFIERDFLELSKRYVSFLDIGGSHAHRLRPLVEKLGIPTVVITDIDPVLPGKDSKGRTVRRATHIASQPGLECGNSTLTTWHPRVKEIAGLGKPTEEQLVWDEVPGLKVRFSWQLPIAAASGSWPSSFEDSLVLTNLAWFKSLDEEVNDDADKSKVESPDEKGEGEVSSKKTKLEGTLRTLATMVSDCQYHSELAHRLHDLLHGSFSKGDFAATLFERINAGAEVTCPAYISDALSWLEEQLTPFAKELS